MHTTSDELDDEKDPYVRTLDKLTRESIKHHYNPYTLFEWPDSLPDDMWWYSPELLTTHGTDFERDLDERTQKLLSKWESINFYGQIVHGIRELIIEVTRRIHTSGYEPPSEFFHRFIAEENDHMWWFARFCTKYGGKLYPDRSMKLETETLPPVVESFQTFTRILVFEEIGDWLNTKLGKDERLHPLIQQINWQHHKDESRHISGGRQVVKKLHDEVVKTQPAETVKALQVYVEKFIIKNVEALYNPSCYRDAGIPNPHQVRRSLLEHPARTVFHGQLLKRLVMFLANHEMVSSPQFFVALPPDPAE